jgi:outer membrane protein OmpA-like peptidoglycan-associated protein
MRILPALIFALVAVAPAMAQDDSVIVGGTGSGRTLIDPATGEPRYVPDLLQPWQNDAIKLRPLGTHRAKKAAPVASAPVLSEPTAAVTPPPKKKRIAAAPPPETPKPVQPAAKSPVRGFADIDLITGTGTQAPQAAAPAPKVVAAKPAPAVAPVAKPAKTASLEKLRTRTSTGSRKDSITFASGASDPSGTAVSAIRSIAGSLSSAMGDNGRIQLMAYAGGRGEKTSDTRRLSLKRALVIRQLLIDDGVPSERIDVFAMGGVDDDGPLDRVDVFLKS